MSVNDTPVMGAAGRVVLDGLLIPGDAEMAVDVTTETVIRRPREEVAEYVSDPDNAPEWYVNIDSVEWKTPRPLAVGSRLAFVARFLGRRLVYTYEVADYVPGVRLVMRTEQGPFHMETSYGWETTPEGHARMTLRNRGTPAGFSTLAAPFMSASMRRANKKDLARLKELLEYPAGAQRHAGMR
jgi:uncharacterized protein YndB with AHSA1/START domain